MKNGKYKRKYGFYYYKDDKLHREDGPAVECYDGYKAWYKEGNFHRLDGPAVEWGNRIKKWIDGPAVEWGNGIKEWWIEGKLIECSSQEEFERIIKFN